MGIGEAIAITLAKEGVNLILCSRSKDKLQTVRDAVKAANSEVNVACIPCDIQNYSQVNDAVRIATQEIGQIDILVNNAGLALGAPKRFFELGIEEVQQMNGTNVQGVMNATHAVLNQGGMWRRGEGSIIMVSSTTALEVPPFPGESVYHANKACIEAFSNALRVETNGSNIKVMVLRPGVVRTHFHLQRVQHDQGMMDDFMSGYEPLVPEDLAEVIPWMLKAPKRVTTRAIDVIPTAQRALVSFDKEWDKRNNIA